MSAVIILSVTIHRIALDVIRFQGKLWLTARDLAAVLGYKCESGIRLANSRHRKNERLADHSVKVKIQGIGGSPVRIFDVDAVSFFCEYTKRAGAFELLRWIDEGGMHVGQQLPPPEIETLPVEEVELLPPPRPAVGLRLVPRGPDPMQQLLEREKAYCRDLVKTFLRYCESEEVDKLTAMVDGQIDHHLETRYYPGLNAARYELFRKYWLQGGGV